MNQSINSGCPSAECHARVERMNDKLENFDDKIDVKLSELGKTVDNKTKGKASWNVAIPIIGALFLVCMAITSYAILNSLDNMDRVSNVEGDIKVIKSEIRHINESVNSINNGIAGIVKELKNQSQKRNSAFNIYSKWWRTIKWQEY